MNCPTVIDYRETVITGSLILCFSNGFTHKTMPLSALNSCSLLDEDAMHIWFTRVVVTHVDQLLPGHGA